MPIVYWLMHDSHIDTSGSSSSLAKGPNSIHACRCASNAQGPRKQILPALRPVISSIFCPMLISTLTSQILQAPQGTHDQSVHHLPLNNHQLFRRQTQKPIRSSQTRDFGTALSTRTSRMNQPIAPSRQYDSMILRPLSIARDLPVQNGLHPRQPIRRPLLPARKLQRRQHEEVGRHERGGRVAR